MGRPEPSCPGHGADDRQAVVPTNGREVGQPLDAVTSRRQELDVHRDVGTPRLPLDINHDQCTDQRIGVQIVDQRLARCEVARCEVAGASMWVAVCSSKVQRCE
jgi:hypothetical protein